MIISFYPNNSPAGMEEFYFLLLAFKLSSILTKKIERFIREEGIFSLVYVKGILLTNNNNS
jgi:hypothetical protein